MAKCGVGKSVMMLASALLAGLLNNRGPIYLVFSRLDLLLAWVNNLGGYLHANPMTDRRVEYLLPEALEGHVKMRSKKKGSNNSFREARGGDRFDPVKHNPALPMKQLKVQKAMVIVDEADCLLYGRSTGEFFAKCLHPTTNMALYSATDLDLSLAEKWRETLAIRFMDTQSIYAQCPSPTPMRQVLPDDPEAILQSLKTSL